MANTLLLSSPILLLVGSTLLGGCRQDEEVAFRAEALTAGPGPLGRNEPLVVRFNRPLLEGRLPARALRVFTAEGQQVDTTMEAEGRHLLVRKQDSAASPGADWPLTSHLRVVIPHPQAGAGLQSQDLEELGAPFEGRVPLLPTRMWRPGSLRLVSSFPGRGATGIRFDAESGPHCIVLEFNATPDMNTVGAGIQVVDLARKEVLDGVVKEIDPHNPVSILVYPFARGTLFNGGTRYELRLTPALRSREGWTLLREETIDFETANGTPRLLQIDFKQKSCLDPRSRGHYSPDGLLRPRVLRHPIMPPGLGKDLPALTDGLDDGVPNIFPAFGTGARSQILIPAEWLQPSDLLDDTQPHRFQISAVVLHSAHPIPRDATIADVRVTLGCLSRQRPEAGVGLGPRFDLNDDGGRRSRIVHRGPLNFLRDPRTREATRVVRLGFSEPFLYDVSDGDLVLSIQVPPGAGVSPPVRELVKGIGIIGFPAGRPDGRDGSEAPYSLAVGRFGEATALLLSRFQPYMWIETMHFPLVISRWYLVEDVARPIFWRDPGLHLKARGLEQVDFKLYFQGGEPVTDAEGRPRWHPDGTPECRETGNWELTPPQDGSRAIRVRVEFEPQAFAPDRLPEIEHILVGYQAR